MIKPRAVVTDIGINQTDASVVGDVDTDAVSDMAGWVISVSGDVGSVTVAVFMRNATVAHHRQMAAGWFS